MVRPLSLLAVCVLVVAAGCLGGLSASSGTATRTAGPTPSATTPPTADAPTSTAATLSTTAAGERAVAAEQARVEREAAAYPNLVGLAFGILDPAEYEVVRRNASGVVVRVDVGYSVSLDCDGDGEPDSAIDGANTIATYLVTDERARLLEIFQGFFDPERYC